MRFRAEQHLRRPSEIRAVREMGRRVDCRAFTLWWRPRTGATSAVAAPTQPGALMVGRPRVCVVASTAAVGDAVHRNRAKRRLRELFRQHQGEIPNNCDLLLVARRAVTEWPMSELGSIFTDACRRLESRPPVS